MAKAKAARPRRMAEKQQVGSTKPAVAKPQPPSLSADQRRWLDKALRRQYLMNETFKTNESLSTYVVYHKYKDILLDRINAAVVANSKELAELGRNANAAGRRQATTLSLYRLLVQKNYSDPSRVFSEIPEALNICQLMKLLEFFKQLSTSPQFKLTVSAPQQLALSASPRLLRISDTKSAKTDLEAAFAAKLEFLEHQWRAITGDQLSFVSPPILADLDHWKAPVPLKPAWSNDLYSLEAKQMKRHAALYSSSGELRTVGSETRTAGNDGTPQPTPNEDVCSMETLYAMAGGQIPRQPGKDDPLYTFPGSELLTHESIFYDYSLMIPVDECLSCPDSMTILNIDKCNAARLLASQALTVVFFIRQTGLSNAFGGTRQVSGINSLLLSIAQMSNDTSIDELRNLKRQLEEWAGLMRLIARTQALLYELPSSNPKGDPLTNLDAALSQLPSAQLKMTLLPSVQSGSTPDPLWYNTLYFPNGPTGYSYGGIWRGNEVSPGLGVPDAQALSKGVADQGWEWERKHAQRKDLRNYVRYLGDDFFAKLTSLKNAADAMSKSVHDFEPTNLALDSDLRRAAWGVVNETAGVLSTILSDIDDCLALRKTVPPEGAKRLAVQLLFRQFWHPEGFVMGRLVGYKNLLPNEKDSIKRRTFIKTTRELTRAEDFASTRQNDYSQTQKQTSEVIKEASSAFNMSLNASGHYDFLVGGAQAQTAFSRDLRQASKTTQSTLSEAVMKGSTTYAEKREVKLRELQEQEDLQEVTTEVANLNREITANYFYYQLLRQYRVTTCLQDIQPALLRRRTLPSAAEVDEKFLSMYAHALIPYLPDQLSADAQETVDRIDALNRARMRRQSEMYDAAAAVETARTTFQSLGQETDANEAEYNRWLEEVRSRERVLAEARTAAQTADDEYLQARTRIDRVVKHLRANICHYMQYIWQSSPTTDLDMQLQEEMFCGESLPMVTRGLSRLGYFGDEEIFEYTGPAIGLLDVLLTHLTPGSKVVAMGLENLKKTELFQYIARYNPGSDRTLANQIRSLAFITDPAQPEEVLRGVSVQIPQDALVIETMPGKVPLLEGFQMAHRMLDVQKACLENQHLKARTTDRPWQKEGSDTYAVRRYEGEVPPTKEVVEQEKVNE
jgi:hypothetical protein